MIVDGIDTTALLAELDGMSDRGPVTATATVTARVIRALLSEVEAERAAAVRHLRTRVPTLHVAADELVAGRHREER